jgi:hemolysin III
MTTRRGHSDVIGRQDGVPRYGRGERIADAAVHILGLAIALLACAVLAAAVLPQTAGPGLAIALGLYAAGLLAMLGCSALYNMAGHSRRRELLRRLDHAAIFAMIAGTYTPVAGIGIGGPWGWALLGVVWTGAFAGAALKLLAPARFERVSILAYLLLGWAGVVALDQLLAALPPLDLWLLVTGGLLYSLGIVVHLSTRLRYHNALWHALVVAAAGCHYAVVLRLAQTAG